MMQSEGEKMMIVISKCIDNQAYCEFQVDQVQLIRPALEKSPYQRSSAVHTPQ